MLRLGGTLLAAVVVASLSGCASMVENEDGTVSSDTLEVTVLSLPNGKSVECVNSRYTSSMVHPDCNWAGASADLEPTDTNSLRVYTVEASRGKIYCVGSKYSSSVIDPSCDWDALSKR